MVDWKLGAIVAAGVGILVAIAYFRNQIAAAGNFLAQGAISFGQTIATTFYGIGAGTGEALASPLAGLFGIFEGFWAVLCGAWPSQLPFKPPFCQSQSGAGTSGAGNPSTVYLGNYGRPTIIPPAVGAQDKGAVVPYPVPPIRPIPLGVGGYRQ